MRGQRELLSSETTVFGKVLTFYLDHPRKGSVGSLECREQVALFALSVSVGAPGGFQAQAGQPNLPWGPGVQICWKLLRKVLNLE